MKTTRSMSWILLTLLVTIFLAACGSGGSGTLETAGDVGPTAEEPAPISYKLIVADLNGDIWQLDENDGSSTELLDVYIEDGLGNKSDIGEVSSMVYDEATGKIYAGTGEAAECNGCIYAIDPSTGEATLFMDPEINAIPAMAIRSDGKILASFEDSDNILYEFDPSIGSEPKLVGRLNAGLHGVGLSFLKDGTLLMGEGAALGIVNQSNGEITSRATSVRSAAAFEVINPNFYSNNANHIISQATFSKDGKTFAVINDTNTYTGYGEVYRYLVAVDEAVAEISLVSEVRPYFDGLASAPVSMFAKNGNLLPPASVSISSGPASVGVSWDKVFSGTYNIYWSASSGVNLTNYDGMISGVTDDKYNIQGTEGSLFYVVVTMAKNGVESEPSDEVSAVADSSRGYQTIAFARESKLLETRVYLADDGKSAVLPIGFDFTFFGNTYSEFVILSNGLISFDTTVSNMGDSYLAQSIPVNDDWNNIIALAWVDISPQITSNGGSITYETLGRVPNRRLVVDFKNVTYYAGSRLPNLSTQAILYEGTNIVEIHTSYQDSCQDSDGDFDSAYTFITQGVENADGTEAYYVPGRVQSDYSLLEDAVRFYTNP